MNTILEQFEQLGITQSMVAEAAGVSQATVSRALGGLTKNRRKVRQIEEIALKVIEREQRREEAINRKKERLATA